MTAAVLQGVMLNTMDIDIWVDLPSRQYMRLREIIRAQGGSALAKTLYVLADGKLVNFVFEVTGLRPFAVEYASAVTARVEGLKVAVLPLARILKSKQAILRDKDLAHIPHLKNAIQAQKKLASGE
ncbi:MAG TPA: hypothetical protein VHH73_17970 [Verrucomicrobiae bacterium]|nr:hypothetical protein [Verrucomicrobiae bacterium]